MWNTYKNMLDFGTARSNMKGIYNTALHAKRGLGMGASTPYTKGIAGAYPYSSLRQGMAGTNGIRSKALSYYGTGMKNWALAQGIDSGSRVATSILRMGTVGGALYGGAMLGRGIYRRTLGRRRRY